MKSLAKMLAITVLLIVVLGFTNQAYASPDEVKVLVIPVRFPDVGPTYTVDEINDWMTGPVTDYFFEVSFGQIELDIRTLGVDTNTWFQVPDNMADYGNGDVAVELPIKLAVDAMAAADEACDVDPTDCGGTIDWSEYNQEGSPPYPVIVVVHAGHHDHDGDESIFSQTVILGAQEGFWKGPPWPIPDDAAQAWSTSVVIASEFREFYTPYEPEAVLGTYAHEMFHSMGWLPDLYDVYATFEDVLGVEMAGGVHDDFTARWALMGAGETNPSIPYLTRGETYYWTEEGECAIVVNLIGLYPSYPTAYSQILLGWIDPADPDQVLTVPRPPMGDPATPTPIVLRPLEDDPSAPCPDPALGCVRVIKIPVSNDGRLYYLVEARKWQGADEGLPQEGVLILTVDESKRYGAGVVRVVDDTPAEPLEEEDCAMLTNELNPLDDATWVESQTFSAPDIEDLTIAVEDHLGDGYYRITVTYPPSPQPDVAITPWGDPPYSTEDIWIDSRIEEDGVLVNDWGEYEFEDEVGNRDPVWFDHPNRVYARIRNEGEGPANDVVVRFYWGMFGAGQSPSDWRLIDQKTVDLSPSGDPAGGDEWEDYVEWTPDSTELDPGRHFCIWVDIFSEKDLNPGNQMAQENIFDEYAASPVGGTFEVTNPLPKASRFYMQVDPFPLPEGWAVNLDKYEFVLDPGHTEEVTVEVIPPALFTEPLFETISVAAMTGIGDVTPKLVGGVSLNVYVRLASTITVDGAGATGTAVTVPGHIEPVQAGARVVLRYVQPDGSPLVRSAVTAGDGRFVDAFTADQPGTWAVVASWRGNSSYSGAESGKTTFVVAPPSVITPTGIAVVVAVLVVVAFVSIYYYRLRRKVR